MGTCVRMSAMSSSSVAIRTLAMSWSRSSKSVSSNVVDLSEAEIPPSLSGMSWMVKNSIGGVELCGAVAPACMSSITFSVLHDRRPRIQAAANKAESQRQSYQARLFRANAALAASDPLGDREYDTAHLLKRTGAVLLMEFDL